MGHVFRTRQLVYADKIQTLAKYNRVLDNQSKVQLVYSIMVVPLFGVNPVDAPGSDNIVGVL